MENKKTKCNLTTTTTINHMANKWYRFIVSKSNFNSQNNRRFLSRNERKTQDIFLLFNRSRFGVEPMALNQTEISVSNHTIVFIYFYMEKKQVIRLHGKLSYWNFILFFLVEFVQQLNWPRLILSRSE